MAKTSRTRPCTQRTADGNTCRHTTTNSDGDCGRHRGQTMPVPDADAGQAAAENMLTGDKTTADIVKPRWIPEEVRETIEHIRSNAPVFRDLTIDGSNTHPVDESKMPAKWSAPYVTDQIVQAAPSPSNSRYWLYVCTCGFVSSQIGPSFEDADQSIQLHLQKHAFNPSWDGHNPVTV